MAPRAFTFAFAAALVLPACDADGNRLVLEDAAREEAATQAVEALLQQRADDLGAAVGELCAAAPAPDADGWNAKDDAAAVASMRDAWRKARRAYAGLVLLADARFPVIEARLDRGFAEQLAAGPDDNPFDDHGVMGLHAVERILWADAVPARVRMREAALDGAWAPAFPANATQAGDFAGALCAALVLDAGALRDGVRGLALDPDTAYGLATRTLGEQLVELDGAASGAEASPYARASLADLRSGLDAGAAVYAAFQPWILAKPGGVATDAGVAKGFARLSHVYSAMPGNALPTPPDAWNSADPSGEALATPFGRLFTVAHREADASTFGTLLFELHEGAGRLGVEAP